MEDLDQVVLNFNEDNIALLNLSLGLIMFGVALNLSVTDFKRYLACPYRFFLNRVLRLESVSDEPLELDGAAFGNRMHEVFEHFGHSDVVTSTSAQEIEDFLMCRFGKIFIGCEHNEFSVNDLKDELTIDIKMTIKEIYDMNNDIIPIEKWADHNVLK